MSSYICNTSRAPQEVLWDSLGQCLSTLAHQSSDATTSAQHQPRCPPFFYLWSPRKNVHEDKTKPCTPLMPTVGEGGWSQTKPPRENYFLFHHFWVSNMLYLFLLDATKTWGKSLSFLIFLHSSPTFIRNPSFLMTRNITAEPFWQRPCQWGQLTVFSQWAWWEAKIITDSFKF